MGRQFADDSATPSPISVSRNSYQDEIPSDRPMHNDATPGMSNSLYQGRHYAPVMTSGKGNTSAPKASSISVTGDEANRGKES